MTERDLAAEIDRLAAHQSRIDQSLIELTTALQLVSKQIDNMPGIGAFGKMDMATVERTLREIANRHQAKR